VGLVREGQPAAFETIYDRHHRGVLSFCAHILGDRSEAEDAAQHVFLAAYSDLIRSHKPINLRAWLFTIARNRCYSVMRARRERPEAELQDPVTEGLASAVQRRQELRELIADLRGLPEEQRSALLLAELESMSHAEVGEILGIPRERVKSLVFQARTALMTSRTARETACIDIREELSAARGAALRRPVLSRHLRECPGCRAYRRDLQRQRGRLAIVLPVLPTVALKDAIMSATVGAGAGATVIGGGWLAGPAIKSGLFKTLAAILAAGATAAGSFVVSGSLRPLRRLVAIPANLIDQATASATAHSHHRAAVRLAPSSHVQAAALALSSRSTLSVASPFAHQRRAGSAAGRGAQAVTRAGAGHDLAKGARTGGSAARHRRPATHHATPANPATPGSSASTSRAQPMTTAPRVSHAITSPRTPPTVAGTASGTGGIRPHSVHTATPVAPAAGTSSAPTSEAPRAVPVPASGRATGGPPPRVTHSSPVSGSSPRAGSPVGASATGPSSTSREPTAGTGGAGPPGGGGR
jgi:RNA polymerase sigma factor (sigma-70 family)